MSGSEYCNWAIPADSRGGRKRGLRGGASATGRGRGERIRKAKAGRIGRSGRRLCHFCHWRTRLLHSHPASELAFSTPHSANQRPGAISHGSRPQSAWCRPSLSLLPPAPPSASSSLLLAAAAALLHPLLLWSLLVSSNRRPLQRHCSRSGLRFHPLAAAYRLRRRYSSIPFFERRSRARSRRSEKQSPPSPACIAALPTPTPSFPRRPTPIHPLHLPRLSSRCDTPAAALSCPSAGRTKHRACPPSTSTPFQSAAINRESLLPLPCFQALPCQRLGRNPAFPGPRADQHHGAGAFLHIVFPSSPRPSHPSCRILLVLLPSLGAARAVFTVITTQHHQHQHQHWHYHPIPSHTIPYRA